MRENYALKRAMDLAKSTLENPNSKICVDEDGGKTVAEFFIALYNGIKNIELKNINA
ncbi:MAG: hypothetical protein FWE74_07600 [Oscillospiraceae bacterium]|nr:hypothetical protein [Oscillospiraceae bacterium]